MQKRNITALSALRCWRCAGMMDQRFPLHPFSHILSPNSEKACEFERVRGRMSAKNNCRWSNENVRRRPEDRKCGKRFTAQSSMLFLISARTIFVKGKVYSEFSEYVSDCIRNIANEQGSIGCSCLPKLNKKKKSGIHDLRSGPFVRLYLAGLKPWTTTQ